ncbi:heme-binding protein [Paraburkholderia sp.]|uniref:GlcG/HbpS family heme-binding protein n=1 Tax=Paraburkholderia sp. TaxID=1926495 RepID=UPI00238E1A7E|nr:heme-binding protein [Paraburkholderia sp.]MDE1184481.1 heme-binding protein [Paraburkholderia sp.]
MRTKPALTDDDVKTMAAAAEAYAVDNQWKVTIAIFDDGGHLLHLHRMDGTAPISVDMACGKGRTAVLGRRDSKIYEDIIKNGRAAFLSAPVLLMVEGGVPVVVDGEVIGAIGVSGVKSEQDSAVARAGIAALGLEADR